MNFGDYVAHSGLVVGNGAFFLGYIWEWRQFVAQTYDLDKVLYLNNSLLRI